MGPSQPCFCHFWLARRYHQSLFVLLSASEGSEAEIRLTENRDGNGAIAVLFLTLLVGQALPPIVVCPPKR